MKKALSLLLTVILLLCSFSFIVPAYAADFTEADLDLSQYTMDDLMNMSAEEYRALLRDFERVYDPFGTYDTDPIMKDVEATSEPEIMPVWGSGKIDGNGEYVEQGSHEMITAQALNVLANDKGIFSTNPVEVLAICLSISLASLMPDKDENQNIFEGHFYHAVDGDSWTGSKTNTALTNCVSHFNQAVSLAKSGNRDKAYEEIGRALHYIQDAGEPHHASNIVYLPPVQLAHGRYEDFVDGNIDHYVSLISSVYSFNFGSGNSYSYSATVRNSVNYFVKGAATRAYSYRDQVKSSFDQSQWNHVAEILIPNAVAYSAVLLYKFASSSGIPLL